MSGNLIEFAVRELKSTSDPAFWDVMELYVESFPRDEREPISSYVLEIEQAGHRQLDEKRGHLLVAEDRQGKTVGMRYCQTSPRTALGFLVYVAVDSRVRRKGIGTLLIKTALKLCEADMAAVGKDMLGACFEVERVELAESPEDRVARIERLKFFQTLGAEVVSTSYVQPALSEDKEPVPLYLLAHHLQPEADRVQVTYDFCTTFLGMEEGDHELTESLKGASDSITLANLIRSFE